MADNGAISMESTVVYQLVHDMVNQPMVNQRYNNKEWLMVNDTVNYD